MVGDTMDAEIIGKASSFVEMLQLASFNGMIGDIGIRVMKDKLGIISTDDAESGGKVFHLGEYRAFEIKMDEDSVVFGIPAGRMKGYIQKVFKSDDEIEMIVEDGIIRLKGPNDEITTARLDAENGLTTYMNKPPFHVDFESFIPAYKGGTKKPTMKATMDADVFKDILKKSDLVQQEYFPMKFIPGKGLYYQAGTNYHDRTNDTIKSFREDVETEGEEVEVTLATGFREICSALRGNIEVHGLPGGAPIWIKSERKNYRIGYMISPRIEMESTDLTIEDDDDVEKENNNKKIDLPNEPDYGDEDDTGNYVED
jgi:hypothetical protein